MTKALRSKLREWQIERQKQWMSGEFLGEGHFPTMVVNARAVGECGMAQEVLDLTLEQLQEEPDEDLG